MPLRPTPDALRERAFSVLASHIPDSRILDLYAGTGSIGLEALSRGARQAIFVEHHRAAANIVRRNVERIENAAAMSRILCRPARAAVAELARRGEVFDLIWADPPFDRWQEGLETLVAACDAALLERTGIACLECPAEADLTAVQFPLIVNRDLGGGASRVLIMELSPPHSPRAGAV